MSAASAGEAADSGDATEDAAARQRAAALLLWYPRAWRDRYGEEFAELLISDLAERPHALGRTVDVARSGLKARLAGLGLAGFPLPGPAGDAAELTAARGRQVAASLASLAAASAVFLVVGAAQWSQLLNAWVWSGRGRTRVPAYATEKTAMLGATVVIVAFLALAVIAAIPVVATVAARLAVPRFDGQRKLLAVPAVILAGAAVALVVGGRALENNWTGTGGLHSPVPGGLAAYIWAVTLFDTAYWAHPALLAAFPAAERNWMMLSPLVIAVAIASAVLLVRRAGLSPRATRFEAWSGVACCAVMTAFLAVWGGYVWRYGPRATGLSLLHIGLVNEVSTVVLGLSLATGLQAARMAVRGLRLVRS